MGILSAIRSALAAMKAQFGALWAHIGRFDTWENWASQIWSGTVDGVKNTITLPVRAPLKGIELGLAGADKSWNYMKRENPRTVGALKIGTSLLTLPLRALGSLGGGAAHSVPRPAQTPTQAPKSNTVVAKSPAEAPIQNAERYACVIDYIRATPEGRKSVILSALTMAEKKLFFKDFTGNLNGDRLKQLADMKDHEILQLFRKAVVDKKDADYEKSQAAKLEGVFKSGSLDGGDMKATSKYLESVGKKYKSSKAKAGEVVELPKKAAMSAATTKSIFGQEMLENVERRTKAQEERQKSFRIKPSGPASTSGFSPA
ncbi:MULTISPECIES: hypothetical protein [unclassified Pannonibacter]|uniref:hypothetical protein n=1 Tax=unclassified Pannonibacter TaxID=2627228 RepID=UPI001647C520|nr:MULTISPECIES: hypothetical protein [unclassified Pannonibacter]